MDDFADFFRTRRDPVFRAMLVAIGDRAGAEDAVAEAFARAYQRWPAVRDHPNPSAWVIRTALNVSRSWWRRRRRETSSTLEPRSHVPPPADPIDASVTRAIEALPRRQREVLAMRLLADMSAVDTAELLGINARDRARPPAPGADDAPHHPDRSGDPAWLATRNSARS